MLVAGEVFGDLGAAAFGVAHFSEDAPAGAGDAFDGGHRAVGVVSKRGSVPNGTDLRALSDAGLRSGDIPVPVRVL